MPLLPWSVTAREGIVNAWDDPAFVKAVRAANRPNLAMAGLTTDVRLVFPTIAAVEDGFSVQAGMGTDHDSPSSDPVIRDPDLPSLLANRSSASGRTLWAGEGAGDAEHACTAANVLHILDIAV